MKNIRILVLMILVLGFNSSWASIWVSPDSLKDGNDAGPYTTVKEAVDVSNDSSWNYILFEYDSKGYSLGHVDELDVDGKIFYGLESNPDSFPYIYTEKDQSRFHTTRGGALARFYRLGFTRKSNTYQGALIHNEGKVLIEKCTFYGFTDSDPPLISHHDADYTMVRNCVFVNLQNSVFGGYTFVFHAGQKFYCVNNDFVNVNKVFESMTFIGADAFIIENNIFSDVTTYSVSQKPKDVVLSSIFYNTDYDGSNDPTNITKNPKFVGDITSESYPGRKISLLQLQQTSPARDAVVYNNEYYVPKDDIGGRDRDAVKAGSGTYDIGAWEYLDFDAPEFIKINKFDIYYDSINRPDYQHARLAFDIEIAPGDWDSIMIRYKVYSDTNNNTVNLYPKNKDDGYLLFAMSRTELENATDSILVENVNNSDTSWIIRTTKDIYLPKSILDSSENGGYIYGKGFYFTMFLNDQYGNWSTRDAVDRYGKKPLDKMRISPLYSLTDSTSITVEGGQKFSIPLKARVDNINGPTPTDYNTQVTATINSGTLNGTTTVNLTNGQGTFTDLSINTPGTYTITLRTQDNLSYTDQVTINVEPPPVIQILDENGKDISEIVLNLDPRIIRNLKVKLTKNNQPFSGTVTLSFKDPSHLGRFNGNYTTLLLTFDGTTDTKDFQVTLPLNYNNTIMAILTNPNKPYVRDSVKIANADNMYLAFTDEDGNEIQEDTIKIFNDLSDIPFYAVLKTSNGTPLQGAPLIFAETNMTISIKEYTTDNKGMVSTVASQIKINTVPRIIVRDKINSSFADTLYYDTRNARIEILPTDDYNVVSSTSIDTLKNYNKLSFPISARLIVNDNYIKDEIIQFSKLSGNGSFSPARDTTDELGEVSRNLTFTPGAQFKGQLKTVNGGITREFIINAQNENLEIVAANDTIKGKANNIVDIPALYTIDGNPIQGIDINFSIIEDNGFPGSFEGPITITTDINGKAIAQFRVQVGTDINKLRAQKSDNFNIFDDVYVYRVIEAPDKIELLRWTSNTTGTKDTLVVTAGNVGKLLVRLTAAGQPIEGTLTSFTITSSTIHNNFYYSFDNITWKQPGILTKEVKSGYQTIYVRDTLAGIVLATASEQSAGSDDLPIKIVPAAPDLAKSSFIAQPTNPYVVNVGKAPDDTTYLIITIRDKYGNVIPGVNVNKPTANSSTVSVIGPAYKATDAKGQVIFKAINTKAETVTFTASLTSGGTLNDKPVVTFLPGPPTAIGSQPVVIYPDTAIANGVDSIIIELNLRDNNGNPISGKKITDVGWIKIGTQKSKTSYTLTPLISVSDETGLLRWKLVDTKAQLDTVKVNVSGELVPPVPVAVFIPGPPAKIVIQDSPLETGKEVGNVTIKAGNTLKTLYGVLYDAYNNYIGAGKLTNYLWSYKGDYPLDNKLSPLTNAANTYFYPTRVGQGKIYVDYNGLIDSTGTITIIGGDPSYVKVTTENNQVETAGVPFGVRLTLYDKFGNISSFTGNNPFSFTYDTSGQSSHWYEPDIPSNEIVFSFTNGVSNLNGSFVLKSADVYYYLLATSGDIKTDTTNSAIKVLPGPYTKIKIMTDYLGNTAEFDSAVIDFKTTIVMHASKFDIYDNYISDVSGIWSLGEGSLLPEESIIYNQFGDTTKIFKFNPDDSSIIKNAVLGKIKVRDITDENKFDLTENIRVISIPDHMVITGNPNGIQDSVYNNKTIYITAGDSTRFYAAVYDTLNVFISNFTSRWSYKFNKAGTKINIAQSSFYDLWLTKVDTGFIFAEALSNSMTGKRDDTTGTIIILPGKPVKILVKILDDDKIVTSGDSIPVELTLVDKYNNVVNTKDGDVVYQDIKFNIYPSQVTPPPHNQDVIYPKGPFVFKKGKDTTYLVFSKKTETETDKPKISAEIKNLLEPGNQDTVWVEAGPPDHIKIMYGINPAIDTVEAGYKTLTIDDSLTLFAVLYDKMGNFLGTAQSNWNTVGFTPEYAEANTDNITIGPFMGLTDDGDVFATPLVSGIKGDTAPDFKVVAGKPVGYDIHVYKVTGLPKENMGDTVAANYGFSIRIRLIDRLGNIIKKSVPDTQELNFKWAITKKYPASVMNGKYVFINGEVIINEKDYPWIIDHIGIDSLLVFNVNNTFIQSWGKFVAVDRTGPSFINKLMQAYDNNGDGFIDSIVVEFKEPIDTTKIKDGIELAFQLEPDSLRGDNITQWLKINKVIPLSNTKLALKLIVKPSAPENLKPKTDLEPSIRFLGNTLLPAGVGIYDLDGNEMQPALAKTDEYVGPVIISAQLDDKCDNDITNDELTLILSENIYYDSLISKNPNIGIVIARKNQTGAFDYIYLKNGASYLLTPFTIGNEVKIELGEAVLLDLSRDYVKLLTDGGFRDTTVFMNKPHKNNPPVRIVYVTGFCGNVRVVPNPVVTPNRLPKGSNGNITGNNLPGSVFKISTDRPVKIDLKMFNIQGNFINEFTMMVTKDLLKAFGQQENERIDFYFGVADNKGYLTPIPKNYYEFGFDVSKIPASLRWQPVNKKGRYVTAGVYIFRIYVDNKYEKEMSIIVK